MSKQRLKHHCLSAIRCIKVYNLKIRYKNKHYKFNYVQLNTNHFLFLIV